MAGVQARLRSEHQRKYPDLSASVWYDVAPIFPGVTQRMVNMAGRAADAALDAARLPHPPRRPPRVPARVRRRARHAEAEPIGLAARQAPAARDSRVEHLPDLRAPARPGVNGFCWNGAPGSSSPRWMTSSPVYPEMNSTGSDGRSVRQAARQLAPAHLRHDHVRDDEIDAGRLDARAVGAPRRRARASMTRVAVLAQAAAREGADQLLVLDHEDRLRAPRAWHGSARASAVAHRARRRAAGRS